MRNGTFEKIAIVEDDSKVREQIVQLINQSEEFRCAGAFASAEEGLSHIPALKPAMVLMDIHLPGMSGIDCAARLRALMPELRILILTVFEESDKIFQALRSGADGYLVKRDVPSKLIQSIRELKDGGSPISSNIARKVIQHFRLIGPESPPASKLSSREQEILDLLIAGKYYKEVADALGIGQETVKTHVHHIFAKLRVRTRSEAVAKFLKGEV